MPSEKQNERMTEPNHNRQLKIANINDISGFGRCSVAVALPIISRLGVQCCPLPTAIFSNHTGFKSFFHYDFTEHMEAYMEEWKKLSLSFDGILTGFLSSVEQIDFVLRFFEQFSTQETTVIVDPVMGDYGRLYCTYTDELASRMRKLLPYADIITPNLTEACFLAGTEYSNRFSENMLLHLAETLSAMGPRKIVITGVEDGDNMVSYCYEHGKGGQSVRTHKVDSHRSGTGDVFSATIAAGAVKKVPFVQSVITASDFVRECILASERLNTPATDGMCFEEVIDKLSFK